MPTCTPRCRCSAASNSRSNSRRSFQIRALESTVDGERITARNSLVDEGIMVNLYSIRASGAIHVETRTKVTVARFWNLLNSAPDRSRWCSPLGASRDTRDFGKSDFYVRYVSDRFQ